MRHLGRAGTRVSILRVPGIYALDRPEWYRSPGYSAERQYGQPRDDIYTNHIQADDHSARLRTRAVARLSATRLQRE